MDELVIEEKKYLSSKKAAKLTGYAKDYVGQLCREGKVEARLVGRNWYVLETSIMDHRFGAVSETKEESSSTSGIPTAEPVKIPENGLEYKWNPPIYTTESYSSLPTEVRPSLQEQVSTPLLTPEIEENKPYILNDMQSAWQEWFEKQKEAEKLLPDASEMMLPEADEELKEVDNYQDIISENVPVVLNSEHNDGDDEYSTEEVSIPIRHVSERSPIEPVEIEKEEYIPISRRREEVVYQTEYSSQAYDNKRQSKAPKQSVQRVKASKGPFLIKVIILSVAAIFAAVTYLAFSSREAAEGGEANIIVNYLTGVSTIDSHK